LRVLTDHSTISATALRDDSSQVLNRVHYGRERLVVAKHRKAVVAIIPIEDLELLEELEDARDVELARKAVRDARKRGEKPVPYADARRRLGL
jgi:prevent-host-death family protein